MTRREMKYFLETVLSAYEKRVQVFGKVIRDADRMLKDLRAQQEALIDDLRERLAKTRFLRRKDFDLMMGDARLPGKEGGDLVLPALEGLEMGGRALCEILKGACEAPSAGPAELKFLSAETLSRLEEREGEAIRALRRSQILQEALSEALRGLASKGEGVEIEDLRRAMEKLRLRRGAVATESGMVLDDLERTRKEASLRWDGALGSAEAATEHAR